MAITPRENAALVRRFLTDVVGSGDTDAVSVFLADDVVVHNLVFGDDRRRAGATALGWKVLAAADVEVEIVDVVASVERVAVRASVTGTHSESLMDLAPTGASFEIAAVWICRIEDGRIAEIWSLPDGLGLMNQLGAIPDLPSTRWQRDQTDYEYP